MKMSKYFQVIVILFEATSMADANSNYDVFIHALAGGLVKILQTCIFSFGNLYNRLVSFKVGN